MATYKEQPLATLSPHECLKPAGLLEDHENIQYFNRDYLEDCWKSHTQLPAPPLSQQGCTRLTNKMYKCVLQNDVGTFSSSEITSESPDIHDHFPRSEHTKDAPGTHDSWAQQMTIWSNTLLMCIWANPKASKLQITKKQLDDFYHHLMGKSIYKRTPLPSLRCIATSERRCWHQIRELVHQGATLGDSLEKMRYNTLSSGKGKCTNTTLTLPLSQTTQSIWRPHTVLTTPPARAGPQARNAAGP